MASTHSGPPRELAGAGLASLGVGIVVLIGWASGMDVLASVIPGQITMKPNTAIGFALFGIALLLSGRPARAERRAGLALACIVGLFAAAVGAQYIANADFGIDQLLFREMPGAAGTVTPGRMSPQAAIAFIALALAMVLVRHPAQRRLVLLLLCVPAGLGAINALEVVYGASVPFFLASFTQMAFPTAVTFIVLAAGVAALLPGGGPVEHLRRPGPASFLARRLLAAGIVIPVFVGWLRVQGERMGLYDSAFGASLMVLFTMTLFIVAVARTARVVQRSEEKRLAAERRLAAVADEITDLYENAPIGYHSLGPDGLFVRMNRTELEMLGYEAHELVGKKRFVDLLTPDSQERFRVSFPRFKETGVVRDLEFELIRRDGSIIPVRISATAARDERGEFLSSRSTVQDISDHRRIEAEREHAREDAEAANRAKSEFLSRMSHELRTPLNSVLGFAQLLEMDELEPSQRENVRYITKAGRHLLELINEVLDISRIETGQLSLSIEPVDLGEVLAEATALVGPLANQRGIGLASEASAGGGPYVMADRQRLRQVFLNVLSNAVKYNHAGGSVAVGVDGLGGRVVVTIKDTGPGIMPEDRERIFVPFERLGAERTEVEGAGIGLALTKSLVEAMRGQIGFDSIVGSGTSFWVSFEVAEAPASTNAAALAGELAAVPVARRRTVLCIEDNMANLRLIERLLSRIPDTHLIQAIQGSLGVALAQQHRPDVILLDLHLPDMTGEDVLQQLRGDPATRDIPVIVVTADGSPPRLRRALELGAAAHVTKPIDVAEFVAVLAGTLTERSGVADVA